ncbi:MAG TPA: hypothetical protein VK503_03245 [Candidatus Bathyarchaeia archaeon]|nr:hypothetical protein [Candidatus Bathyarchaeia archaeon]
MSQPDVLLEAQQLVTRARGKNITLRLVGGTAVAFHCPSAKHPAIARQYLDIDLVGLKSQARTVRQFFSDLNYASNDMFNALHGGSRLMFFDSKNRRVDIFLDRFGMCHTFDLRERLSIEPMTIPLADLLATKLQVVQTTLKDFKDIVAILLDHEVGDSDKPEVVNATRLAELCSGDWGVYKTFTGVLAKTIVVLTSLNLSPKESDIVRERVALISKIIESRPKSIKWQLRSNLGEKVPWYVLPEDPTAQ